MAIKLSIQLHQNMNRAKVVTYTCNYGVASEEIS